MNYGPGSGQIEKSAASMPMVQTLSETLAMEKGNLRRRLADIEEAEAILAEYPKVERLLTILGRRF